MEQQANPRLRGKPIAVTGGDRMKRTVVGSASIEAKRFGVKGVMQIHEAKKLCPELILVKGDSDKYLETTKRFLSILKDYSPTLEIFSIDECFLELPFSPRPGPASSQPHSMSSLTLWALNGAPRSLSPVAIAENIKKRIREEVGEWISCSVGISYNKMMAKLAGSLYKRNLKGIKTPQFSRFMVGDDGIVVIKDPEEAMVVLDRVNLDDVCGIGFRIKRRLNGMGIFDFQTLRKASLEQLQASFKTHTGQILYNYARGTDHSPITPFYEKEEVKSVGHRLTINHDTANLTEIKQIFLKLSELIARRLRAKKLVGKTISAYFRNAIDYSNYNGPEKLHFTGDGMQLTIPMTDDGFEIFKAAWKIFNNLWDGGKIRMIGISISNLSSKLPQNLSFFEDTNRADTIIKTLDLINNKYGEFTLQRGVLLQSVKVVRKANPFLADRRFKL